MDFPRSRYASPRHGSVVPNPPANRQARPPRATVVRETATGRSTVGLARRRHDRRSSGAAIDPGRPNDAKRACRTSAVDAFFFIGRTAVLTRLPVRRARSLPIFIIIIIIKIFFFLRPRRFSVRAEIRETPGKNVRSPAAATLAVDFPHPRTNNPSKFHSQRSNSHSPPMSIT